MKNPIIIAELKRIAAAHGGILQAETVVSVARDPASPLHSQFTWDDGEAAIEWRLHQARVLISRVVVKYDAATGPVEHQVFVSVSTDRKAEGGGYRILADALSDDELRAQLLADARRDMAAFRQKYARLTELADVLDAMAKTENASLSHATPTPAGQSQTIGEADAAKYLGVSRAYLSAARLKNPRTSGPPYVRQGRRVTYLLADLDAWLQRMRVTPAPGPGRTDAPPA